MGEAPYIWDKENDFIICIIKIIFLSFLVQAVQGSQDEYIVEDFFGEAIAFIRLVKDLNLRSLNLGKIKCKQKETCCVST